MAWDRGWGKAVAVQAVIEGSVPQKVVLIRADGRDASVPTQQFE